MVTREKREGSRLTEKERRTGGGREVKGEIVGQEPLPTFYLKPWGVAAAS